MPPALLLCCWALLPLTLLFASVMVPAFSMPPAPYIAVLLTTLLLITVAIPPLPMPPPLLAPYRLDALLALIVLFVTVRTPVLAMPPALVYDPVVVIAAVLRSEEHTSELQSQSNLVCRL